MRNDFGSDVFQYVFSDMSTTNKHLLEEENKKKHLCYGNQG